jgi:hypothetical protein
MAVWWKKMLATKDWAFFLYDNALTNFSKNQCRTMAVSACSLIADTLKWYPLQFYPGPDPV